VTTSKARYGGLFFSPGWRIIGERPATPTKEHIMARPRFDDAWAASLRIYDRANSAAKVAEVIGGYVA
jgi:hypothetical protein